MRNTTLGVALLELAAIAVLVQLAPTFQPGLIGMAVLVLAGVAAARWSPRQIIPESYDADEHVAQLEHWCYRLQLDTPEIKRHQYTATGEKYWLRVTGDYTNEQGHRSVMTPEMFHSYWPKFRAVAGDNCRGVFISKPDRSHGGRCTLEVVWAERGKEENPWPIPVMLTDSSIRMCYSDAELAAAQAEADANGYVDPDPAWPAPNAANRVGEG